MLPSFLITFREVIEATLIVATILGILTKLGQFKSVKTVLLASFFASIASIALLIGGSLLGFQVHQLYTGKTEELFEGMMMIISAIFITWAVFWLHKYFGKQKLALLQKVKSTIETGTQKGLFILAFTAVFREGFEIVLFLSTIYLSSNPVEVLGGFSFGLVAGLIISAAFFTATIKMPVYRAFQITTVLLVLFAAGLLARGAHEFTEAGILPEFRQITLYLPAKGTLSADLLKTMFGWSRKTDYLQLSLYAMYIGFMRWYLYTRKVGDNV